MLCVDARIELSFPGDKMIIIRDCDITIIATQLDAICYHNDLTNVIGNNIPFFLVVLALLDALTL